MCILQNNPYLNENMINNNIELIVKNYKTCKYLKIPQITHPHAIDFRRNYFNNLCFKLDTTIDSYCYKSLMINKIKNNILKSNYVSARQNNTSIIRNKMVQTKITAYYNVKRCQDLMSSYNTGKMLFRE